MGTYSYFRLTLTAQDPKKDTSTIINAFREACPDAKDSIEDDGSPKGESKWYEYERDLKNISQKIRGVFFELSGRPVVPDGEDDKPWALVYINGSFADSFEVDDYYVINGPEKKEEYQQVTANKISGDVYPKPTKEVVPKNGAVIYLWNANLGRPKSFKEAAAMAQYLHAQKNEDDAVMQFLKNTHRRTEQISPHQNKNFLSVCQERRSTILFEELIALSGYFATIIPTVIDSAAARIVIDCNNWDILLDHIMEAVLRYWGYVTEGGNKKIYESIVLYVIKPKVVFFSIDNDLMDNENLKYGRVIGEKEFMQWKYRADIAQVDRLPASLPAVKKYFAGELEKMLLKYGQYNSCKGSYSGSNDTFFELINSGDSLHIDYKISSQERPFYYSAYVSVKWDNPTFAREVKKLGKVYTFFETKLIFSCTDIAGSDWESTLNSYSDVDNYIYRLESLLKPLLSTFGGIAALDELLNGESWPDMRDLALRNMWTKKCLLTAHLAKNPKFDSIVRRFEERSPSLVGNSEWLAFVFSIRSIDFRIID